MKSITRSEETDDGRRERFGVNNNKLEWGVNRRDWNEEMV